MFPTEPIRRYIQLSFAKKNDETATAYAHDVSQIRLKMSPNSGMYFQAIMNAGVRVQKAKVDAWIEIVRAACREANRPVDNEVRNYMLGEIHNMCEAGKGHVAHALANQVTQSGMKVPDNLLPSLVAQANDRVAAIETTIRRDFKIEELREDVNQRGGTAAHPLDGTSPPPTQVPTPVVQETTRNAEHSKLTRGEKIALWVGIPPILIALVALVVMVAIPETRLWLKLDRPPKATQPITSPTQAPPTFPPVLLRHTPDKRRCLDNRVTGHVPS